MPIHKTQILGNNIEINHEEKDKEKLIKLIQNFKKRLEEFPNNGRVSNSTIIFLSALKAEDQLEELKTSLNNKLIEQTTHEDYEKSVKKLTSEIITLKEEIDYLKSLDKSKNDNYDKAFSEFKQMEIKIQSIKKKIKDSIDGY